MGGGGEGVRDAGNGTRTGVLGASTGAGDSTSIADVVEVGFLVVNLGLALIVDAGLVDRFLSLVGVTSGDDVWTGDEGA